jgi:hypothetical protein
MNAGAFVKGQKKPNQGKRGPNKTTVLAREAIAKFVDGNAHRLGAWLDDIAADSPEKAFNCFMDVVEYHVPKLARTELTGENGGALQVIVKKLTV